MSIFALFTRAKSKMLGQARDINDPHLFHQISLIAFFAWVGLGADGISSSCYGPEEAFLALGQHTALGVFLAIGTMITIFIISASYRQIIELFPTGGGGYLVASKLLSPTVGMISGCALMIDYLLTITLSVASGADALFSFLPLPWLKYKLLVAVAGVLLLIWMNLRGVKESVLPLVPIFLTFIVTHASLILISFLVHTASIPAIYQDVSLDMHNTVGELGWVGALLLLLRAYSMGAGTFTGIEAVSNGIPVLREPKVRTAKRTMTYMALSLSIMVGGLMVSYLLSDVAHVPGKTLNAVLLGTITRHWGQAGYIFMLVTLLSEAILLFVAAQTGFLDGPRVLANMALDRWMPGRFASLNDRLVTQNGILIFGVAAIGLMLYSHGSVKFLVVLYSINVFITFSLSQLGMVRHWWQSRKNEEGWFRKLLVNGIGLVLCLFILIMMAVIKFHEGGWLTIFITGSVILVALGVKRHYRKTARLLGKLNSLMKGTKTMAKALSGRRGGKDMLKLAEAGGLSAKTAVLFVNGYNGTGLHTLLSIVRLFNGLFQRFIFVQIGMVDSGVFKGVGEMEQLRTHIDGEVQKYVEYVRREGLDAHRVTAVAVDVVEESLTVARAIREKHPDAIFFAGQLVFPEDTFVTRFLHNYTAFAMQRRFYQNGLPILILPIQI